jgi:hypothetical protein
VDVVSEEDCTDMKTDEVYRPSVLCVKTEYEVSIVMKCFCGAYLCVCVFCSMLCLGRQFYMCKGGILSVLW